MSRDYGKGRFGTRGLGRKPKFGRPKSLSYFYNSAQYEKSKGNPNFVAWRISKDSSSVQKKFRIVTLRIDERPLMALADKKVKPRLPSLWRIAAR